MCFRPEPRFAVKPGCLTGGHGFLFSHTLVAELDAIGIVCEAVEDGIGIWAELDGNSQMGSRKARPQNLNSKWSKPKRLHYAAALCINFSLLNEGHLHPDLDDFRWIMLIIFSGLPGTGKSTIAKALAAKYSAAYIRVDEIENAVRNSITVDDIGPAGYVIAYAIARSNIALGNLVIADSVNPVLDSRQGWRDTAQDTITSVFDIEVVCSNEVEHRRRVETRPTDIPGHKNPTWARVKALEYACWTTNRLVIDTALIDPDGAVEIISRHVGLVS